jgi:hypothetical protein
LGLLIGIAFASMAITRTSCAGHSLILYRKNPGGKIPEQETQEIHDIKQRSSTQ